MSRPSGRPQPIRAYGMPLTWVRGTAEDFAQAHQAVPLSRTRGPWFQYRRLHDGSDYLRWPAFSEFLISHDGRKITGRLLEPVPQATLETYLLTHAASFALIRRGIEPLHATTVVIHGKAVAFLADSGSGKSTLAAACLRAGFPLLTDDLLVLKPARGRLLAMPGSARIKLMPALAHRLLGAQARGVPMNPLTSKLIIPLRAQQHHATPVPLGAVYALRPRCPGRRENVAIRRLPPAEAWRELTAGTFNLSLRDPERLQQLFEWAGRLAQQIELKSLSYPRTLRALPRVVNAIAEDLSS